MPYAQGWLLAKVLRKVVDNLKRFCGMRNYKHNITRIYTVSGHDFCFRILSNSIADEFTEVFFRVLEDYWLSILLTDQSMGYFTRPNPDYKSFNKKLSSVVEYVKGAADMPYDDDISVSLVRVSKGDYHNHDG